MEDSNSPSLTATDSTISDIGDVAQWDLNDLLEKDLASKSKKQRMIEWGFPGSMTQGEVDIYVKFRDEVNKRGGVFRQTVYSFSAEEGEAYTLTRWLRARKYSLTDTITMVEEATAERAKPRQFNYYPDPEKALGVDPTIFVAQYPQLYSGFSKTGCPVFYSKPGRLEIDGVECITTLEGILKYHWHVMQHDYRNRLLQFKKENPDFKRFECVSILDLEHLTVGKLGSRTMDIIKEQAKIDSLCFPETMNKMVIVNAPRFFTATWAIIKGFIDGRTASKVDLFSSTSAAKKKLKEIIDVDQLPCDYGGTAESTEVTLVKALGGASRIFSEVLYVRSSASTKIELKADEEVDLLVFTRSKSGAEFTLMDGRKNNVSPPMTVTHTGEVGDKHPPTKMNLTPMKISGPMSLKVKASSSGSMFSSTENFLVVGRVYKK
jgi:hypothetical protein